MPCHTAHPLPGVPKSSNPFFSWLFNSSITEGELVHWTWTGNGIESKNDFADLTCSTVFAERAITNSFKPVRSFKTSLMSFNAGRSNSSYKQGIKMLVDLFLRLLFNSLSKFLVTPYSCIVVIKPCWKSIF